MRKQHGNHNVPGTEESPLKTQVLRKLPWSWGPDRRQGPDTGHCERGQPLQEAGGAGYRWYLWIHELLVTLPQAPYQKEETYGDTQPCNSAVNYVPFLLQGCGSLSPQMSRDENFRNTGCVK